MRFPAPLRVGASPLSGEKFQLRRERSCAFRAQLLWTPTGCVPLPTEPRNTYVLRKGCLWSLSKTVIWHQNEGRTLSHAVDWSILYLNALHQEFLHPWLKYCRLQGCIACDRNLANLWLPVHIRRGSSVPASFLGVTERARQISDSTENSVSHSIAEGSRGKTDEETERHSEVGRCSAPFVYLLCISLFPSVFVLSPSDVFS